nr:hypothetical protein [Gammaproteobacteria bacterium]
MRILTFFPAMPVYSILANVLLQHDEDGDDKSVIDLLERLGLDDEDWPDEDDGDEDEGDDEDEDEDEE